MKQQKLDQILDKCDISSDWSEEKEKYSYSSHKNISKIVDRKGRKTGEAVDMSYASIEHNDYEFLKTHHSYDNDEELAWDGAKEKHEEFIDNLRMGIEISNDMNEVDDAFQIEILESGGRCMRVHFLICMGPSPTSLQNMNYAEFPHLVFESIANGCWQFNDGWWHRQDYCHDNYYLRSTILAFLGHNLDTGMCDRYHYRRGIVESINYLWD